MTDIAHLAPGAIDTPGLIEWLRTEPPPEQVAATRDEAMRRADYFKGRDAGTLTELRRAARVCEWEMARRWPVKGAGGPRNDDRPTLLADNVADRVAWQRVYAVGAQDLDWILSLTDPDTLTQAAVIAGPPRGPHVKNNSGQNEWYTPPHIIEAARAVLGGIDTDPATSALAQLTVRAGIYYTAQDDGLSKPWYGSVWLNPPYSQPLIDRFVQRLVDHAGPWVCLTNNGTETVWCQTLLQACTAACFIRGRLRFIDADGEPSGAPLQGQMVTYYGPRPNLFAEEFAQFGKVLR